MKRFTKRKYQKFKPMRRAVPKGWVGEIQTLIEDQRRMGDELKHMDFAIGFANLSLLYLGRRTKEYIN
jgi:hypothetical protein